MHTNAHWLTPGDTIALRPPHRFGAAEEHTIREIRRGSDGIAVVTEGGRRLRFSANDRVELRNGNTDKGDK